MKAARGARAIGAAALFASVLLAAAASHAADSAELEELRSAVRESRKRVGGHERQERETLVLLEQSDRLLAALTREIEQARAARQRARETGERLAVESREAERLLAATRRAMSRRVVALYKSGEVGPLRFVFATASLPEMLQRVSALQTFVEYDAKLVRRHARERTELARLREEAVAAAEAREAALKRLEARGREYAQEREARRRLLLAARADRTQERALLVELEKASRALEETLAALGGTGGEIQGDAAWLVGEGFAERRGALDRPVPAPIELPFGLVVDEEFHTETLRKGVEFAVEGGETVRAVAPGSVRFAGWFRGYGKVVIVDQGDEYLTVMSHLDEIFVEVGDSVSEGDTLGSVGDTGSLRGPSLYFEIRHGSEPLDPADWFAPRPELAADHGAR